MDLAALAEKHRALWAAHPADVRNIQPSIREFERYVTTNREELAVVGELRRIDPDRGSLAAVIDPAASAAAIAEGGGYGVCVCTDEAFGGSLDDLRAVSAATTVPVLARGMVVDEQDLYRLRDAGADGAVLYARLHTPERITALRKAARSMRIELLVEVFGDDDLERALEAEAMLIAVSGTDLTGKSDLARAKALLEKIPQGLTPVLCGGFSKPEELADLLPLIDAVVVMEPLMAAAAARSPLAAVIEPYTHLV